MNKFCLLLLFFTSILSAQTPLEKTFERTAKALKGCSLGSTKAELLAKKPGLPKPKPNTQNRIEIVETIAQDGLEKVSFYFGASGKHLLYEIILEFSSEALRKEMAEKMFGPPNHPANPEQWILGVEGRIVSMGWSDGKKFAFAANFPGTEWAANAKFKLPAKYELHKNLPLPTDWPKEEITRFFVDLQLQIDGGAKGFVSLKGAPVDNYFECTEPITMAGESAVVVNADKSLMIKNEFTSGMTLESANEWKTAMSKVLDASTIYHCPLQRAPTKLLFGKKAEVWQVLDKDSKPTGVRIGLVAVGDLLYSVFVVVMTD